MYQIDCDVINDVLPLYIENMASNSTKRIVEEHIKTCEKCRSKLNSMTKEIDIPADFDVEPMNIIKKKMERKNIRTAIMAGIIVLAIAVLTIVHMNSPISLKYSRDMIAVEANEDGSVSIAFSSDVAGYSIETAYDEEAVYSITCWTTLWNKWILKNEERTIELVPEGENKIVRKIYYYSAEDQETGDRLIYESSVNKDENIYSGRLTLPRLVLNYYFLLSMLLSVIGMLLCFVLNWIDKYKIAVRVTLVPVSYLISSILVLWGQGDIYNSRYYFTGILILAIILYLLMYFIIFRFVYRNKL